jgi:hypothetical protein
VAVPGLPQEQVKRRGITDIDSQREERIYPFPPSPTQPNVFESGWLPLPVADYSAAIMREVTTCAGG